MQDIRISDLSKSYDRHSVLSHVSMTFKAGECSAVTAPSGAGKTTLLRLIMGLEKADAGSLEGIPEKIAAVFQEDRLLEYLSPVGNIRLVSPSLSREDILPVLQATGLEDAADQPVEELSGGMRRRVALARAVLAEWDLLILDEPFNGLDSETRDSVIAWLKSWIKGKTVILVTHDAEEIQAMEARRFYL